MKETITEENLKSLIKLHKIYLKELSGNVFPIGDKDHNVLSFCPDHRARDATPEDFEFILNSRTKEIEIEETTECYPRTL